MRFLKQFVAAVVVMGCLVATSGRAEAAKLTLMDGTDTWTLTVQTGCSTCLVLLKVVYGAASARAGEYLQSVQWSISDPNISPVQSDQGFIATTAGAVADWTFIGANLNNNGCTGGSSSQSCGDYLYPGYGPIVAGSTLTWLFNANFNTTVTSLATGNIRGAYNIYNASSNETSNGGIFSPGGGNFTTGCADCEPTPTDVNVVPEPTTLALLGTGLLFAARGFRRKVRKS